MKRRRRSSASRSSKELLHRKSSLVPVGEGIADRVIGDALSLVRGQQVLPCAVPVGEGLQPGRAGNQLAGGGIGVFLPAQDVPARVVGILGHLPRDRVVFPYKLVQTVVPVGDRLAVLVGDGRNIPVVVIGVGIVDHHAGFLRLRLVVVHQRGGAVFSNCTYLNKIQGRRRTLISPSPLFRVLSLIDSEFQIHINNRMFNCRI